VVGTAPLARVAEVHTNLVMALDWALATTPEAALEALGSLGVYLLENGLYVRAGEWFERVAAHEAAGTLPWARAVGGLGAAAAPAIWGRVDDVLERAITIASDLEDEATVLRCRCVERYRDLESRGNVDDLLPVFHKAEVAGLADVANLAAIFLALHLPCHGRARDASVWLPIARQQATDLGSRTGVALADVASIIQLRLLGRYDEAVALSEPQPGGDPHSRAQGAFALIWVALDRADLPLAIDAVGRFTADDALHPMYGYFVGVGRAVVDLLAGDLAAATDQLSSYAAQPLAMSLRPAVLAVAGHCRLELGDRERAEETIRGLEKTASRLASPYFLGLVAFHRGALARDGGDPDAAEKQVHGVLTGAQDEGLRPLLCDLLELLATCKAARGRLAPAVRLAAAAQGERDRLGYRWRWPYQQRALDEFLSAARQGLSPEDYDSARSEGVDLDLDRAVAYARRSRGERGRPSHGWASLSPAEREVAQLVGRGLSNDAIAQRLVVGRATVRTHLNHVYTKLGLSNRASLAVEAARRQGG
jgi:DNA-binding CsgD family transcriptional regulator